MLYTIEDKTLTAMGDAIRSYKGFDEYPALTTSFKMNYLNGLYKNEKQSRSFIFENVAKIKAIINITWEDSGRINQPIWVAPGVFDGSYDSKPDGAIILPHGKDIVDYEIIVEGDSIGFGVNQGNGFNTANVSVELVGLDENGKEYKYTPLEMVDEVYGIIEDFNNTPIIPDTALKNITGDCQYKFANGTWDWVIDSVGDKITTADITNTSNMFCNCYHLTEIPFEINLKENPTSIDSMFYYCNDLKTIPQVNISRTRHGSFKNLFHSCENIREVPEWCVDLLEQDYNVETANSTFGPWTRMFYDCCSLREIPERAMASMSNPNMTGNYYGLAYSTPFQGCASLDRLVGIPCDNYKYTSNQFKDFFQGLYHAEDVTFATQEDGTPYVIPWKSQVIDLSSYMGYFPYVAMVTDYNSGLTTATQIKDDATYQTLKDNPDSWTTDINYSRYNHDSAVNTINSLPDCSATGTNTIKFQGAAGALTDGGAINTLTEEEIAVAAAKGWTVSLS